MTEGTERRAYTRHSLEAPIDFIKSNSTNYFGAKMCNYSKGGISIEANFFLRPGSNVFIKMENYPPEVYIPDADFGCPAQVVWCREKLEKERMTYLMGTEYKSKFWEKSYDDGVEDLNPALWETTYVEALRSVFEQFPDKVAVTYMGTEVSFDDLDRYSNRFAQMLLANGLQKGDVVAINLPNIPEYIIAWLGTLKAGAVVSGLSPLLSSEEMAYQLRDSGAKVLVTLDAIFADRLVEIAGRLEELEIIMVAGIGGFLSGFKRIFGKLLGKIPKGKVTPLEGKVIHFMGEVIKRNKFSSAAPEVKITPDDLAYIQYTGGTTGMPKGAMLSHRNIYADLLIFQRWVNWKEGQGIALSGFPFFHLAGLFFNMNCVYLGWSQVLIPNPRDTRHICAELARYKPNVLVNVPSLFQILIKEPGFLSLDHSKLRMCISGASPFPEESQKELEKIVGKGKILEVYGMTETAPLVTANPLEGRKKIGSIGLPLINTDIKLKDPATRLAVPLGEPGEICVKGPQVMVGYLNKPEETQAAFDDEGYLHTGDVAVQDEDGYLTIIDRTKDMIIVGGFKVFSKRVEEILSEHPAIDMIALIGKPNPERPGSELVEAHIVLSPDYDYDSDVFVLREEILIFAKERLAPYEVPKLIEFREELPLTPIGKIDKKALRNLSLI